MFWFIFSCVDKVLVENEQYFQTDEVELSADLEEEKSEGHEVAHRQMKMISDSKGKTDCMVKYMTIMTEECTGCSMIPYEQFEEQECDVDPK